MKKAIVFPILGLPLLAVVVLPGKIDRDLNRSSALPPYSVGAEAQQLFDSFDFVVDLHSDSLLWDRDLLDHHEHGHVDLPRMLAGNVGLQMFTIVNKTPRNMNFDKNTGETDNITLLSMVQLRPPGSWFDLPSRVAVQSSALFDTANRSEGRFRVILDRADLQAYRVERLRSREVTAGMLGIEGAQALVGEIDNVDRFYALGVRMIGLVHFFDNEVAGSAHGVEHYGLTDFGKQVVARMEELGILVDISHSSPQTVTDVLDHATRPIIVSHTGVKGTCDNVRNLSDQHLRRIGENGGIVGIAMFEFAVCGTDAMATAKAIKYTADLIGVEHVALGSDFDGAVQTHFDVTGLALIVEDLLELGMSEGDIRLVMGENVSRLLLESLRPQVSG